jgi:hypothetical protein
MAEKEDFVSDDGYSTVPGAVGDDKKKRQGKADKFKDVDPEADTVDDDVTGVEEEYDNDDVNDEDDDDEEVEESKAKKKTRKESIEVLFAGQNLSEDFKKRASVIFESAVTEAAELRVEEAVAEVAEEYNTKLDEAVTEITESMTANLDSYLDMVVQEWMQENAIAIESATKVAMAESLLDGMKNLLSEHNVNIDESTVDVIAELEEDLNEAEAVANKIINENLELKEQLVALKADVEFDRICADLTESQKDRMKKLSKNIDKADLDVFKEDLNILKESFFGEADETTSAEYDGENDQVITEEHREPVFDGDIGWLAASIKSSNGFHKK